MKVNNNSHDHGTQLDKSLRTCMTSACCSVSRGDLEMRLSREAWRRGGASVLLTCLKLAVVHLRVRAPGSTFSCTDQQKKRSEGETSPPSSAWKRVLSSSQVYFSPFFKTVVKTSELKIHTNVVKNNLTFTPLLPCARPFLLDRSCVFFLLPSLKAF